LQARSRHGRRGRHRGPRGGAGGSKAGNKPTIMYESTLLKKLAVRRITLQSDPVGSLNRPPAPRG
jgi:hypothetical protein